MIALNSQLALRTTNHTAHCLRPNMMIALGAFGVFLTSALGLDRHAQLALSSRNAAIVVREVDLQVVEIEELVFVEARCRSSSGSRLI